MTFAISTEAAIQELARDPLRHVVLLKQLLAYPTLVRAYRASGAAGTAILLALDARRRAPMTGRPTPKRMSWRSFRATIRT